MVLQTDNMSSNSASLPPGVRRLWLVRHGVTFWNREKRMCGHSDVPLSPSGEEQAHWVATQLHTRLIAHIYTSDLVRASRTAEIIAERLLNVPTIQTLPDWREISFGDWEGLTYAQIAEQYQPQLDFFTDPLHHSPPQGEAFLSFIQRVQEALGKLVASIDHQVDGDIVLVSHGGVLRVLLCLVLGIPFERQWQMRIDHGSLSAIDFVADGTEIIRTATLVMCNFHQELITPD